MTANVDIKRGDLHMAVSTAFNRGRYVLMTGGGDGSPIEITIDLRERPDDLFQMESTPGVVDSWVEPRREDIGVWRPFSTDPHEVLSPPERHHPDVEPAVYEAMRKVQGERERRGLVWQALNLYAHATGAVAGTDIVAHFAARMDAERARAFTTDDHGPAIPAQGEPFEAGLDRNLNATFPRVYEFALQDIRKRSRFALVGGIFTFENVEIGDAPDQEAAAAADWVHVYDRVTRERRTLKRPEPDAVLTGLRDVAADLRGKTYPEKADAHPKGLPVEPPFGCAALPPVGPLTSTEGLKPGDVLSIGGGPGQRALLRFVSVRPEGEVNFPGELNVEFIGSGSPGINDFASFSFVGRPDADGWMTWAGGENPVPGARVAYRVGDDPDDDRTADSDMLDWSAKPKYPKAAIIAFRIVDSPPAV